MNHSDTMAIAPSVAAPAAAAVAATLSASLAVCTSWRFCSQTFTAASAARRHPVLQGQQSNLDGRRAIGRGRAPVFM